MNGLLAIDCGISLGSVAVPAANAVIRSSVRQCRTIHVEKKSGPISIQNKDIQDEGTARLQTSARRLRRISYGMSFVCFCVTVMMTFASSMIRSLITHYQ